MIWISLKGNGNNEFSEIMKSELLSHHRKEKPKYDKIVM